MCEREIEWLRQRVCVCIAYFIYRCTHGLLVYVCGVGSVCLVVCRCLFIACVVCVCVIITESPTLPTGGYHDCGICF